MAKQIGAPTSGSVRADTYARNQYGSYIRNRSIPVNPNTPKQANVRTRLTGAQAAWRALTDLQRAAWATYASLHPRTNSLGEQYILSPVSQFVSNYCLALAGGKSVPSDPPTDESWGIFEPTIVASIDTTGPTRVLTIAGANQPSMTRAAVFAAPPTSVGRVTPAKWTQIDDISLNAWATPVDVLDAYESAWGVFSAGQRVYLRVHAVGAGGGRGPQWTGNAIVADVTP